MNDVRLAAIVLTKNEERDLPACLDSLHQLATEIYVIDSGSTDRTVAIARDHGATVLANPFLNYAAQFNWALDHIPPQIDWVLRIDADERIGDLQRAALRKAMSEASSDVTGFELARRIRFLGRELKHGDTYPIWLLRVWRRGMGRCEETWMDEHIVLTRGTTRRVEGDLIHDIPKDLTEWTAKHNWYATRECQDIANQGPAATLEGQAQTKRWFKQNIYLRLPPFYRALAYWCYRYFLKFGFLDGTPGLVYHFLQGFWYRLLVDAKLYEAATAARHGLSENLNTNETRRAQAQRS